MPGVPPKGDVTDEVPVSAIGILADETGRGPQLGKYRVHPEDLDGVYNRMQMWVNAMSSLEGQAKMSVQANAMGTWKLGKTEEHCDTCRKLNGKRHRLRWFTDQGFIPREPGSETLECGGWNCDCGIFSDSGSQLI